MKYSVFAATAAYTDKHAGAAVRCVIYAASDPSTALIGRLTGRALDIRREPAQKGDMRDTYADTSLARRDIGFAPSYTLDRGLAAECQWLTDVLAAPRR